jgi:hypothetical protein
MNQITTMLSKNAQGWLNKLSVVGGSVGLPNFIFHDDTPKSVGVDLLGLPQLAR